MFQAHVAQRLIDGQLQFIQIDGLAQIIERTLLHRLYRIADFAEGRQHNGRQAFIFVRRKFGKEIQSVAVGQT